MRKRYLFLLLLVILGIALLNLEQISDAPLSIAQWSDEEPDYYGNDLRRRQFDASGTLQQSFAAASLEHFPDSAVTRFRQPHIITTGSDGKSWQIDALTGEASDTEQLITLREQVEIRPLHVSQNEQLLIETSLLHYRSGPQTAESDEPVQITSQTTQIHATGMLLNVPAQTLQLHHQVNTRYVPPASE